MRYSILFTIVSLLSIVTAHNVLLPANGKRCFFEQLRKNDELAISFQFGNRDARATEQLTGDFWVCDGSSIVSDRSLTNYSLDPITIW